MTDVRSLRFDEQEIEFCEAFVGEHGLAALLDHFGLDGLANEVSAVRARVVELEAALRREWWANHGCVWALYGDDGEMSCGNCNIDFKRLPFDELRAAVNESRLAKAARVASARVVLGPKEGM